MNSNQQTLHRGLELFNSAKYFEAHEVLEDLWRESTGDRKQVLQALVQVAVGLHHHSTGNLVGAESVLTRATNNLDGYPDRFEEFDLRAIRSALQAWLAALHDDTLLPPAPKISLSTFP